MQTPKFKWLGASHVVNYADSKSSKIYAFVEGNFCRILYFNLCKDLIKYTPEEHSDFSNLQKAFTQMTDVAQVFALISDACFLTDV